MSQGQFRCCIFDFAGTLVDLRPAVVEATLAAVEQWAPGKLSRESLTAQLSGPLADPFITAADGRESLANEMRRVFLEHWEAHRQEFIAPFPGVKDLLAALSNLGTTVVVTSGSMRDAGIRELEASGLGTYVSATVFQDDIARPKPYADAALRALEVVSASPEETLLIGDSDLDIQCGRLAGISTGAALWGALDRVTLLAEEPDFALEHPSDVVEIVRKGEK